MKWTDHGLVLGRRRYGEGDAIVEMMTHRHGRHLGLIKGGGSRKNNSLTQPGNKLQLVWRARLEIHLGGFQVEPLWMPAAILMDDPGKLYLLQTVITHLRLLGERDPYPVLYNYFEQLIAKLTVLERNSCDGLSHFRCLALLLSEFERFFLQQIGFGLDFSRCAATGQRHDLVYVSPKSGRAISARAGKPYHDRLLTLPGFLGDPAICQNDENRPNLEEIHEAFVLYGFFLEVNLYQHFKQRLPQSRDLLLKKITPHNKDMALVAKR